LKEEDERNRMHRSGTTSLRSLSDANIHSDIFEGHRSVFRFRVGSVIPVEVRATADGGWSAVRGRATVEGGRTVFEEGFKSSDPPFETLTVFDAGVAAEETRVSTGDRRGRGEEEKKNALRRRNNGSGRAR
jgi:hypothetical protein